MSMFEKMDRDQLESEILRAEGAYKELKRRGGGQVPGADLVFALEKAEQPMRSMTEAEKLEWLFKYHSDVKKNPIYDAINLATRRCAEDILKHVPACADRTHALRLIRDVRMWANAAVACDGISF